MWSSPSSMPQRPGFCTESMWTCESNSTRDAFVPSWAYSGRTTLWTRKCLCLESTLMLKQLRWMGRPRLPYGCFQVAKGHLLWWTEARQARSRGTQEVLQGPAEATAVIRENRPFQVGAVGCRQSTMKSYNHGGHMAVWRRKKAVSRYQTPEKKTGGHTSPTTPNVGPSFYLPVLRQAVQISDWTSQSPQSVQSQPDFFPLIFGFEETAIIVVILFCFDFFSQVVEPVFCLQMDENPSLTISHNTHGYCESVNGFGLDCNLYFHCLCTFSYFAATQPWATMSVNCTHGDTVKVGLFGLCNWVSWMFFFFFFCKTK